MKPGKGAAFVRTKLKNYITGNVVEKTFRAGESAQSATLEKKETQFTYQDGDDVRLLILLPSPLLCIAAQIGFCARGWPLQRLLYRGRDTSCLSAPLACVTYCSLLSSLKTFLDRLHEEVKHLPLAEVYQARCLTVHGSLCIQM